MTLELFLYLVATLEFYYSYQTVLHVCLLVILFYVNLVKLQDVYLLIFVSPFFEFYLFRDGEAFFFYIYVIKPDS
jgi:hypothetical protein